MREATPRSAAEDVVWPGLPELNGASLLALLYQLDRSQYWLEATLRARQYAQLGKLAAHAYRAVPFWRARLREAGYRHGAEMTPELFARLPVLTRAEAQAEGARLFADAVPKSHGTVADTQTSGSMGRPLAARRTQLAHFFWHGTVLRDADWHDMDLSSKYGIIRRDREGVADPPQGRALPDWGASYTAAFATGPAALLDLRRCGVAEQVAWLLREQPGYLHSFASNIAMLARHCLAESIAMPFLRGVRPFGEVVPDDLPDLCRAAWGAACVDTYSAEEVGIIALQCPHPADDGKPRYHVQAETMICEVLRDDGGVCAPGEVGRVVLTPLHNFAMPMLRYEIGDLAEAGAPCGCGRTLPVLTRILGRTRDQVVLPSGETRFAYFGGGSFSANPSIVQSQIVQRSTTALEFRLVARPRLTAGEEQAMADSVCRNLGHRFEVSFVYVDDIPREASGKFKSFRCEIA